MVKLPVEKLIGNKITNLFPGIEQTPLFKIYENVMEKGKMERIINEYKHPDGSKGYDEVSIYPVPEGILCIARDITEEKRAEQKDT